MSELPEWEGPDGGSGCINDDCDAKSRHLRVLSVFEAERMYPRKSQADFWPLPPQATHVCDRCGFVYEGVTRDPGLDYFGIGPEPEPAPEIPEWDWEPEMAFDRTLREAIERFVEGRPPDVDADLLVEAVEQHVPGVGRESAREVISQMDLDVTVYDASEFM